ncbi:hypothetical protein HN587_04660 [Candidatus Woesearchaeota archaeon]|jgi:hypothetical protein|nr:hypothetical protein [Candidatus Woesearchaeota archaeon]
MENENVETNPEPVQDQTTEAISLGGSIELVGFRDLDRSTMVILKKMIGNHVRKMTEISSDFESISISKKNIHGSNKKVELHAKAMVAGRPITRDETDFNIFFTIDRVLSSLSEELKK